MTATSPKCIRLNDLDSVAVALVDLSPGEAVGIDGVVCRQSTPSGHKLALTNMGPGTPLIKYGQVIGTASGPIRAGDHVHVENLVMSEFDRDYAVGADYRPVDLLPESERATFDGYLREDGRVGTRNWIGVLSTVSCSASVCRFIAESVTKEMLTPFPNVNGVVALTHGAGCCMPPGGEGLELLRRTLAGYARNPNFGGILLVGLGCEVNLVENLMDGAGLTVTDRLKPLVIQEAGGTRKTVDAGVGAILEMLPAVGAVKRQPFPAAHLTIGLECGGSDAYSGITANPALGAAVDLLVGHGGTAILSETPEIYGAEHMLTRRAASADVGRALIDRIEWWRSYTKKNGAEIDNNPTPGNKAGGLTTILEKSLGAVAKGGSTSLNRVYGYAETVGERGLVFMDTPGYDVVSITGMIAGGANLVLFTTGRGTVCGFNPVPTLKLATNSEMYRRLEADMDIDCGLILSGDRSIGEMGRAIFETILKTASGAATKSEALDFGSNEFVPWHIGAVL